MKTKLDNIKGSGFKVPANYFNELEETIIRNSKLKKAADSSGFNTPDNYFENFEDKILETVTTEPKVIALFSTRNLVYISSIAAAIVILISVFNRPRDSFNLEAIETASIENYLFEEGLATSEIASLFSEENITNLEINEQAISTSSLETYLLNNADIEDIIEQ